MSAQLKPISVIFISLFFGLGTFAQKKSIVLSDSSTFVAKFWVDCYYFRSLKDASGFDNSMGPIPINTLVPLVSMYRVKDDRINYTSTYCKILYAGTFFYVSSLYLKIDKQVQEYLISKSDDGEGTREQAAINTLEVVEKYNRALANLDSANQNLAVAKAHKAGLGINYYHIRQNENNFVDFDISLINYSSKTVKYAYVTIFGYNGVKDLVGKKTLTLTGPSKSGAAIPHGEEQIFYSSVLCRVDAAFKLSIQIKYMDGTSKLYSGKTIDDITFVMPIDEDFKDE